MARERRIQVFPAGSVTAVLDPFFPAGLVHIVLGAIRGVTPSASRSGLFGPFDGDTIQEPPDPRHQLALLQAATPEARDVRQGRLLRPHPALCALKRPKDLVLPHVPVKFVVPLARHDLLPQHVSTHGAHHGNCVAAVYHRRHVSARRDCETRAIRMSQTQVKR